MVPSVIYLGHVVDSEVLHPNPAKVKAVAEAPRLHNVQELKSFLGLLTYYGTFLPNLSTMFAPLNALLSKDTPWTEQKHRSSLSCCKAVVGHLKGVGAL